MSKLLMIDDNPIEHLIMQRVFKHLELFEGAKYMLDGGIVIEDLEKNVENVSQLPDIVLLDLNMPGFSGWDFLNKFKLLYPYIKKNIDIYIISSSIDRIDHHRSKGYPFVKDFLTKPIQTSHLKALFKSQSGSLSN